MPISQQKMHLHYFVELCIRIDILFENKTEGASYYCRGIKTNSKISDFKTV